VIKYYIVIDIVGLEFDHLESGLIPNISRIANQGESAKMEPVFPAVTCTVQASVLSGTYPNKHGIIANGLYDRTNHSISFWEQSSDLVQTDRIWDIVQKNNNDNAKNNKNKKKEEVNDTSSSLSSSSPSVTSSSLKSAVLFWQTLYIAKRILL
jgi:hypothetical protein